MENNDNKTVPMILKTGELIKCISEHGGQCGISRIASDTGFSKSTTFRIVKSLEETGLLIKDESTERYQFSSFFVKAGMQVRSSINIRNIAMPIVEKNSSDTQETTNLFIPYKNEAMVIDSVPGASSVITFQLPPVCPLYCTAAGKLFLLDFSDDDLTAYFDNNEITNYTAHTIINKTKLSEELKIVKAQGYSIANEEYEYGLLSIAVPVIDNSGKVAAALSIFGPSSRIEAKGIDDIVKKLKNNVSIIEQRMGYRL